jgi:hypothetical protein
MFAFSIIVPVKQLVLPSGSLKKDQLNERSITGASAYIMLFGRIGASARGFVPGQQLLTLFIPSSIKWV